MSELAGLTFNLIDALTSLRSSGEYRRVWQEVRALPLNVAKDTSVNLDGIRPYSGSVLVDELCKDLEDLRELSTTILERLHPNQGQGTVTIIGTKKKKK